MSKYDASISFDPNQCPKVEDFEKEFTRQVSYYNDLDDENFSGVTSIASANVKNVSVTTEKLGLDIYQDEKSSELIFGNCRVFFTLSTNATVLIIFGGTFLTTGVAENTILSYDGVPTEIYRFYNFQSAAVLTSEVHTDSAMTIQTFTAGSHFITLDGNTNIPNNSTNLWIKAIILAG